MKEDSINEFWNRVPGPGEYDRHQFAKIPQDAALWEGVRIGVTEYLGERWVVEVVDKDNLIVRRTDTERVFRLKQTFKTPAGELDYAMWTTLDAPPGETFAYMVGAGTFKRAIERDIGIPVGFSGSLGAAEGLESDGQLRTAVSMGDAPNSHQTGLVARWFVWSILMLQWVAESIEANPDP